MRILILGINGMLGSDLHRIFLNSFHEVVGWTRNDVDVTDFLELKKKIFDLQPDCIINATGYTNVEKCEDERDIACKINGDTVKNLAEICLDLNAILIHYSTDYVFDGSMKDGYLESHIELKPVNTYGYSKALGESQIGKIQKWTDKYLKFYLIRISWLFGANGKNFVNTMLDLSKHRDELSIVNDQYGNPTYTCDVAKRTLELINWEFDYGIYHVSNEGVCSWYDFAKMIFSLTGKDHIKLIPLSSTEYPSKVVRPQYSSLLNTKLPPMRSWEEALEDYLKANNYPIHL